MLHSWLESNPYSNKYKESECVVFLYEPDEKKNYIKVSQYERTKNKIIETMQHIFISGKNSNHIYYTYDTMNKEGNRTNNNQKKNNKLNIYIKYKYCIV